MNHRWGIDLGGTKIEGVIINPSIGLDVIQRKRIPTESQKGYTHILQQIKLLHDGLVSESGFLPKSIGIGTPGTLEPSSQTMKNCNTTSINGQPLKRDLQELLGIPVFLSNDANCFAIAESKLGIVPEYLDNPECIFGIIMGTGVGGGVVCNGKLISGRHGIGGEWGHNFLDISGGDCYCGRKGCVEQLISGPALESFYKSLSGEERSLKEISDLALQRNKFANSTMNRLHHFFGKSVANIINILDPEAIVIGGGVGNIESLYTSGVEEVKKYVFNNELETLFLKPKLGDSAGVFGAALLEY